jgi:hypothetical protein
MGINQPDRHTDNITQDRGKSKKEILKIIDESYKDKR